MISEETSFAATELLEPGTFIDHFEVQKLIGRGGMGEVYLARDTRLGRRVALKLVSRGKARAPDAVERIRSEARTIAQFSHPHIVAIHAVGDFRGAPYLALEYLEGETLAERLRREKLSVREAIRIGAAIAQAVSEAHRHHTLHRDLKPRNVLLPRDGRLRVVDFGMAAHQREAAASSAVSGTPAYMAPEQWRGEPLGPAVDAWAIGAILYELVTGARPYAGCAPAELKEKVASPAASPRIPAGGEVPAALAELVAACLEKDPARRPGADEIAARLRALLAGSDPLQAEVCPYPGLTPYTKERAHGFHGREGEIEAFVETLREQPLLAVIGPSGVGKSSFVHGGVVPRLDERGRWLVGSLRPGGDPFRALAACLLRLRRDLAAAGAMLEQPTLDTADAPLATTVLTASALRPAEPPPAGAPDRDEARLARQLGESPGLLGLLLRHLASVENCRVALVVDQLEELFTLHADPTLHARFLRALTAAADDAEGPVRAILVVRDDFLARVVESDAAGRLVNRIVVLRPPTRESLERILTRPLAAVGYRFEDPALVREILDQVPPRPASLPLVQFAMRTLWEHRDEQRRLLLRSTYQQIGGVGGALAEHAEAVLQALSATQLSLAKEILLRLVTADRTRRVLPRAAVLQGLPRAGARVLDRLVDSRLVGVLGVEGGGDTQVELAHDSLVDSWRRLAGWIDERRLEPAYLREEIDAEKRFNRFTVALALVLLVTALLNDQVTGLRLTDPNSLSNLVGVGLLLAYSLVGLALLRRGFYRPWLKYVTMFATVTFVTLVVAGYSVGSGWVHSLRTVTLTVYFVLVATSGIYHRPLLSLSTGMVAALEYAALFATAVWLGNTPVERLETFARNVVSLDQLFVYEVMLVLCGALTAYVARRHRRMLQQALESDARLRSAGGAAR